MRPRSDDRSAKSGRAAATPAEQLRRLEHKVQAQKETIRALMAQTKALEAALRRSDELAQEVTALTHEVRELTRANRDQATRYELLRSDNDRLRSRASAKRAAA